MSGLSLRVPFPPVVLMTLIVASLLLFSAYLIAPPAVRLSLLACAGLLVMAVAFTSVELTLYLLIMSTMLSPELHLGGGGNAIGAAATLSRDITLRLDDILLAIISLTWLFRMVREQELGAVRKTPINQPILWYMIATTLATLIGFAAGRVGVSGFFFVLKYLEYFVLFYMVINQTHDDDVIKRYITVMLFTCFVVSLVGIAQIPSGERVSAPFEGEIGEPNTFGGYLMLMFAVTLGIFLDERNKKLRPLWVGLMIAIIVPLAFTESRSSYLAFVVMAGLFILLSEKKRLLIAGALVGLTLMPFVLPGNVINRVMFTFGQASQPGQIAVGGLHIDTSTSERMHAWGAVVSKDFPKRPLFGNGVTGGRFLDAQYPRVLSETGIIGLITFIWFLRRIWTLLRQCHREIVDDRIKGAALGTLCGFGGLLFHAIGSNSFTIVRIMEPFMILLGLMLAALLIQRQKNTDIPQAGEPA